ncbi:MAG: hypothetical protein HY288_17845 [Planctomycetia bacterium]|nr:hypothetical protein [Planctomycetia bacterium]
MAAQPHVERLAGWQKGCAMPISPEQQAAFLADLKKFRAALAEDFHPPDDWPHGGTPLDGKPPWPRVNAYRGKLAGPLLPTSQVEHLDWPDAAKDFFYQLHDSLPLFNLPHGRRKLRETIDKFLANVKGRPVKLANEARDK